MNRIILVLFLLWTTAEAQDLKRRASWEASISKLGNVVGAKINSINANSPLAKQGIISNDIVLKVNGRVVDSGEKWTTITYGIRAGEATKLLVRRNSEVFERVVFLNPLGRESHKGMDTFYESITSDFGITQRTIVTKPKNANRKLPAIMLLQGLSCSTVENHEGRNGNWPETINRIIEDTDMVVMRIDKPGVGDSEGDCASTDFETELAGYRAAIRELKTKEYVDTTKIIIYGSSMGSALAPLLANEFGLAGIISDGTFFKTWFEHMLEIERRIRKMSGDDESIIVKKMNEAYIPLYYGMLIEKKSYQEIVDQYPAIRDLNYHSPEHMYGRPVSYYQQLQDTDLAGEWERIKVPVRILYGLNDWIMSEFDNDMIIKVLEAAGHEDHELVKYPGLDHWNTIHESPDNSFNGKPGKWDPEMPALLVKWAKELTE